MKFIITYLILFSIQLFAGIGVGYSPVGVLSDVKPSKNGSGILKYDLAQNFPNPFNPSTIIAYSISASSNVTIKIYNVLGELVTTLVNEYQSVGSYNINFNASGLSNGIYFYKLQAGNYTATKKMLLLK
jgi:hypothetical protein